MSISYKQAPILSPGEPTTAKQLNALADAVNSRLIYGIGDCNFRIHSYFMNLFRQVRNPTADEVPLWPSMMEWSAYYCFISPSELKWPDALPGDYEGANLANPAMKFVFGDPGIQGEGDRIEADIDSTIPSGVGDFAIRAWELGKRQRGVIDTGSYNGVFPAMDAAQSHMRMAFFDWSNYEKSVGGYLPVNESAGTCTDSDGNTFPSYIIKFVTLDNSTTVTFPGTCGPTMGGSTNDVAYIRSGPFAWFVYQFNGNITRFDYSQWKYVRDGGGYLSKEPGDQIDRLMLNQFVYSFAGSTDQRPVNGCWDIEDIAVDNDRMLQSQWQLAPQKGYSSSLNTYTTVTSSWTWHADPSTKQIAPIVGYTHNIYPGFRVGGLLATAHNLTGSSELPIINVITGSSIFDTFTIPLTGVLPGTSSILRYYDVGPDVNIAFDLINTASFASASGYINIEISELIKYQPEVYDMYLIDRLSTTNATSDDTPDQVGFNYLRSKEISDNYFLDGVIEAQNGASEVLYQQQQAASANPVLEAARQFTKKCIKLVHCKDLSTNLDLFVDIGISQSLDYSSQTTSSYTDLYFKPTLSGNQIPFWDEMIDLANSASNGIHQTAVPGGYSNRWIMTMNEKLWRDPNLDPASLWKPSVYGDYWPYIQRSHVWAPHGEGGELDIHNNGDIYRFENATDGAGTDPILNMFPEGPSMLTFAGDPPINSTRYGIDDYTRYLNYLSFGVYRKPYEIIDARYVRVGSNEYVKITLNDRLHYSQSAAVFAPNFLGAWNPTDIKNELYRTSENCCRAFVQKITNDFKHGDCAMNGWADLNTQSDKPDGAAWPTFFFTKLVPTAFVSSSFHTGSSNATSPVYPCPMEGEMPDYASPMSAFPLIQAQTYITAIHSGYIDDTVSLNLGCQVSDTFQTAFDFTLDSLCNQTFGKNYFSLLNAIYREPNSFNRGFGPLPNVVFSVQHFNEIALAINKLVRARVPLPYNIFRKGQTYVNSDGISVQTDAPEIYNCGFETKFLKLDGTTGPAATTLINDGEEVETGPLDSPFQATTVYTVACNLGTPCCDPDFTKQNLLMQTFRTGESYRIVPQDALAGFAFDFDVLSLIQSDSAGIFGKKTSTKTWYTVAYTPGFSSDCGINTNFWTNYTFTPHIEVLTECGFFQTGVVDAGITAPASAIGIGWISGATVGNNKGCSLIGQNQIAISIIGGSTLYLLVPTIPAPIV